jgi:hypothetical protein
VICRNCSAGPLSNQLTTFFGTISPRSGSYDRTSTGSVPLTILPIFSCDPSASVTRVL